jgi:hypothetical protein
MIPRVGRSARTKAIKANGTATIVCDGDEPPF